MWHEIIHVYQQEILHMWDPNDGTQGHSKGWTEAIEAVYNELRRDGTVADTTSLGDFKEKVEDFNAINTDQTKGTES